MDKKIHFEQWLSKFNLGWLPIALYKDKQIFMLIDFRSESKYIYVLADSRKQIMQWILGEGKNIILEKSCINDETLSWHSLKKLKRGKIMDSFEIVRILESELPNESIIVYDIVGNNVLKTFNKIFFCQQNINNFLSKKIIKFSETIFISPTIYEFDKGWNWRFHEAVFQTGISLEEFNRMYLLRGLYRREKLDKKLLGWKVQFIRDIGDSENLESPFWSVSCEEEQTLKKLLQKNSILPKKFSPDVNTPSKERKRRTKFQNKINSLIRK